MSKKTPISRELSESWHRTPGWKGQFRRMRRWYRRVQRALTPDDIEDFLYAFFQNCYHLRDWLQNSDEQSVVEAVSQQSLTKFFRENEAMRLCQDICNGTKHFSLDRSSFGREFSLTREYDPLLGRFGEDTTLVILIGGTKRDLFDLAAECLQLWVDFLRSCGLDPPSD